MLKLTANPTFTAPVKIHQPGGQSTEIKVVFKYMGKKEYNDFIEAERSNKRTDKEAVLAIATGWEGVEGPFNEENVAKLCDVYHTAATAMIHVWIEQLTTYKAGN